MYIPGNDRVYYVVRRCGTFPGKSGDNEQHLNKIKNIIKYVFYMRLISSIP